MEHEDVMTIEQIDHHLETHLHKTSAKAIPDLCGIYQAIKPILKFIRAFLFWKPKWQAAVDMFIGALDQACPVQD